MIQVDAKMKPGLRVDVQQVLKPGFSLGEIKMAFVIGAGATPLPRTLRPHIERIQVYPRFGIPTNRRCGRMTVQFRHMGPQIAGERRLSV